MTAPTPLPGIANATSIAGGGSGFTVVLTSTGTALAAGANSTGQLGNNSTTNADTFVNVDGWDALEGHASPTQYTYDGNGPRVETTSNTDTRTFAWDMTTGVPQMLTNGADSIIYGAGGIALEQIDASGTPTYFVQGQLGSTRALTDQAGNVVATYSYDAYGAVTGQTGAASTPIGFAGAYTDPSGLLYLVHRYYDPATGQFLSLDPLVQQTSQPYQYAGNNPVNATDPSGRKESCTYTNTLLAVPIDSQLNGCGGVWVDSYLAGYINHDAGTMTRMTNGGAISGAVLPFGVASGKIIRYLWNNAHAPGSISHSHRSRWATMPESDGACTANDLAHLYLNASGFAISAQLGLLPLYEQYVGAFQVFAGNDKVDHHAEVEGTLAYWMDRVANGNVTNYEQAVPLAQSEYLASFCMGFEGDINGCNIGENVTQHIANSTSYNQPTEGTNYPTVCPESESRWIV